MGAVTLANFRERQELKCSPIQGHGMIYKITPRVSASRSNGYVGRTSTSLYNRLILHVSKKRKGYAVHRAIQKYGATNFTVHVIENNIPEGALAAAE
jgi:hypothetical protein